MKYISFLAILSIVLSGCASGFATNYKPITSAQSTLYIPSNKPIEIIQTENIGLETKKWVEEGYLIMGVSDFVASSGSQNLKSLEKQASLVNAQVVLVSAKHLGSTTMAMPMTTPTSNTSTTNYNLYGSYGTQVSGMAQTTTYGTQTQYVPVTLSSTRYSAYFLGRFKNKTGVYPFELNENDKLQIEQNFGIKVGAVVRGSPAYLSGILANDIILKANKKDIYGVQGFLDITNPLQDESLEFDVYRNGKTIKKVLKIEK